MDKCADGVCGVGSSSSVKLSHTKNGDASGKRVSVEIYSDPACPWCYVGKCNLDSALASLKESDPDAVNKVVVNWRAFFIDPATNPNGEEYLAYNRRRWGSDGWTYSLPGRQEGTRFVNWKTWPNTLHAARLIHLAGARGGWRLQHQAEAVIFRMIYEDGLNVSDLSVLEAAGRELGLEGVRAFLDSDELKTEVLQEAKAGSRAGISGVPFFICSRGGEPVTLSGAQSAKTLLVTIKRLLASRDD